jgi:ribonuclease HI
MAHRGDPQGCPQSVTLPIKRLQFSTGTTNNEAEYKSLIAALEDLIGCSERANRAVGQYRLEIRGDSALVLNQV